MTSIIKRPNAASLTPYKVPSPPPYVEEIISSKTGYKMFRKDVLDLQSDDSLVMQGHYGSESSLFTYAAQTLHIKALSMLIAPSITLMSERIDIGTGSSLEEVTLDARDTLILMADHIVLGRVQLKCPSISLACRRLTLIQFPEDDWSADQRQMLIETMGRKHPFCHIEIIEQ